MEMGMWLVGGALTSGFLAAYHLSLASAVRHFFRRMTSGEGIASSLSNLFAVGFRPVLSFSDTLLQVPGFKDFCSAFAELQEQQHRQSSPRACASVFVVAFIVMLVCSSMLMRSVLSGLAVVSGISALVAAGVFHQQAKRMDQLRTAIPEVLQTMRACFQAGFSLEQTLAYLSQNAVPGLSQAYQQALTSLKMGSTPQEALAYLKDQAHAPELVFVSVALDIQHQTGGSLSPILGVAETSAREQFELEQSLNVQTAQARLSSRIVSVMPFVIVAVFSLLSPDFFSPFFESILGAGMLLVALGMEVAGVVLVRKTLQIKGVNQ